MNGESKDYLKDIDELERQLAQKEREIRRLKVSLRAEELKVKISSEYTNFALWEYDIAEDICYQYKKLDGKYEKNLEPIVHFRQSVLSWGMVYSDDLMEFNRLCDALERGDAEICFDIRCINDNCDIVWFRYEGKTIYDEAGVPLRVVGRTLDVTSEKGSADVFKDERRDELTGALTPEAFKEEVMVKAAGDDRYKSTALLIMGIDGFDDVAQKFGREYSDRLEKILGKILSGHSACEQGSAFGRVKPGVFAVYARFADLPALNVLAARIIHAFVNYPFHDKGKFTLSGGISLFKGGKAYDDVYKEAYAALKATSEKGGNGYLFYSSDMMHEALLQVTRNAKEMPHESAEASGTETVYRYITKAFIDTVNTTVHLRKAFREAGVFTGASQVYISWFNNGHFEEIMTYSYDGANVYDGTQPAMVPLYKGEELLENLMKNPEVILSEKHGEGRMIGGGFKLVNGAVGGISRTIMCDGYPIGYFAFVSNRHTSWQRPDLRVISLLNEAVNRMFSMNAAGKYFTEEARLTAIAFNNLDIENFTIDPVTYEVDYVSAKTSANMGLKSGDVCYKVLAGLDRPCRDCPTRQLKEGQVISSCADYRESEHRWVNITASEEENRMAAKRYYIVINDITSYMNRIQFTDSLTGLMTFDKFTAETVRITSQRPDRVMFMCVIGIADFRRISDDKGYEFGNSLLIAVADIISSTLSNGEMICRSDGAKFILLLKNSEFGDLQTRFNKLLPSIQGQVKERCGIKIHVLAGAYKMGDSDVGVMGAIDRAMSALKAVKSRALRNQSLLLQFDGEMVNQLTDRRYIEAHMVEALDNGEFKVFYQPKVSASTGRIVGAEALVRWIRPGGEIISPARFISLFEENGFIVDMDYAVYTHAAEDIKRWIDKGLKVPPVSLNVSRRHIKDAGFPEKLKAVFDRAGVPHGLIELEITESLLAENLNNLVEIMNRLKADGFSISVDDFGSGYSSLSLITLLPFDTLKIDGGFFLKNELTDKNKTVIESVIKMAKSLNLDTVSEGVETAEQAEFLKGLGCDMIQGFYCFHPMSVVEYEKLLVIGENRS